MATPQQNYGTHYSGAPQAARPPNPGGFNTTGGPQGQGDMYQGMNKEPPMPGIQPPRQFQQPNPGMPGHGMNTFPPRPGINNPPGPVAQPRNMVPPGPPRPDNPLNRFPVGGINAPRSGEPPGAFPGGVNQGHGFGQTPTSMPQSRGNMPGPQGQPLINGYNGMNNPATRPMGPPQGFQAQKPAGPPGSFNAGMPPKSQTGPTSGPPRIGQPYQNTGNMPPTSQNMTQMRGTPTSAAAGSQGQQMGPPAGQPPLINRPPGPGMPSPRPPTVMPSTGPPTRLPQGPPPRSMPPSGMPPKAGPPQGPSVASPDQLPLPYGGHLPDRGSPGFTPSSSDPPSQKSSRAPSPLPVQQYDAMEGQFIPTSPGQTPTSPQGGQPLKQGGITGRRQYPQMAPGYNQTSPPVSQQSQFGNQPATSQFGNQPAASQFGNQPATSQFGNQPATSQFGNRPITSQFGSQPAAPAFNQSSSMGNIPLPPPSQMNHQGPGTMPGQVPPQGAPRPQYQGQHQNQNAGSNVMGNSVMGNLNANFNRMSFQHGDTRAMNLLQEKNILPNEPVEPPPIRLPNDNRKVNCSPDIFRCTLNAIPQTQAILNKARLPLGILIHPFKDLSQLPVIQSSVIVRCRTCRTYINPFVVFVDQRRWKCNLCYRVNECPDDFQFDPISKTYGAPTRRPEFKSATIEYIAPSQYMLRPPQPAVYLFLLDVSFNAVQSGYLSIFCQSLLEELDRLPGDSRTQIGFLTFDSAVHFYNLAEGLSQPQMLIVSDLEEIFLPSPDSLLVNLSESKDLIADLLNTLPQQFEHSKDTGSALGAALQAAHKLMTTTGGRVTVVQTVLPSSGPGALKCREETSPTTGKNVPHLGPATDFYKKLALDCSGQQIAVDQFLLTNSYVDIATLSCASKYSGGTVHYYPSFHAQHLPGQAERFETDLKRYFSRKIGFEAVMRIRCSRGLSIHTFHGNFFVRSTDLLSLPNINPDAGFGMQMSIEDPLTDGSTVCFQAALLYTSSKGERRIRVHTMCLPVSNQVNDVIASADQQAIVGLLAKMGVDRTHASSLGDAREAMINAAVDAIGAFSSTLPAAQRIGSLSACYSIRLLPMYVLAMMKSTAFRAGSGVKLDERVFALEECKSLPLQFLMMRFYPDLYPVHNLEDKDSITKNDSVIPQPPRIQLSSANVDRHGAYLLDSGNRMILWVGGAVSDKFCQEVFDRPNFMSIQDGMTDIPELDNPTSERIRTFINHLLDGRPFYADLIVLREDSRGRMQFINFMVEDRTESAMSYYEFLQHIQKSVKS
ncbi:protein transport protein Sec24A-like isoform X2 [Lineus longissimus]|uniref:protein transport protein Sec24A-like isoform X2 n=1 Tax=Lineus longissimus TaxID=88925 RepID=UPI00315D07C7